MSVQTHGGLYCTEVVLLTTLVERITLVSGDESIRLKMVEKLAAKRKIVIIIGLPQIQAASLRPLLAASSNRFHNS